MKVTVDIPFALLSYVKFIPEDMLPEVLLQALEDKVKGRRIPELDTQDAKYDEILSILNKMQSQPLVPVTMPVVEGTVVPVKEVCAVPQVQTRKTVITFDTVNQDDAMCKAVGEEDEDEFLFDDLMK